MRKAAVAPAREWERRQAEYSPPPLAPRPPRTVAEIAAVWVPIGVAALSVLGSLAVVAHTASQTLATHDLRIANLETGAKEHSASDEKKMDELTRTIVIIGQDIAVIKNDIATMKQHLTTQHGDAGILPGETPAGGG